jgi:uncharacterized protein (TIGR00297 family)
MLLQWIGGFFAGIIIGWLAYRLGALSASGAAAAALTGGMIFGSGGMPWAGLLLTFFITSSALSRLSPRRKQAVEEKYAKGSRRDWGQVLANGGAGALLALAHAILPVEDWPWLAFAGAMAAVNADTWATELGVLNPSPPRLITSGKSVERGTSGAVSLVGYLAALGGALIVGLVAGVLTLPAGLSGMSLVVGVCLAGLAGSTIDSLLGATLQAIYWCPACQKETERHPRHTCGNATVLRRGLPWMSNDLVNFICSLVGAAVAAGWFYFA